MRHIQKPLPGEYPAYSEIYISLIPGDGLVLKYLKNNFYAIQELIYTLPDEKLYHRYAANKWSIKEILVHIIDDERIFTDRALRYARNDKTELPGFNQDEYVMYSKANERSLDNIFEEYEAVRNSTIALFNGFPNEAFMRTGVGVGDGYRYTRTVRALAYHIAGHEQRHINIIKERYLQS